MLFCVSERVKKGARRLSLCLLLQSLVVALLLCVFLFTSMYDIHVSATKARGCCLCGVANKHLSEGGRDHLDYYTFARVWNCFI